MPETKLDTRFSGPGATATPWERAREELETAETYWLSTVRADGRPHVTPLIAVWRNGSMYFCTGPDEQKAKNLENNAHVILTTGCSSMTDGLDLVVEGDAVLVSDDARLEQLAAAYEAKYGSGWHFDVRDGRFRHDAGDAIVFEVAPAKVLGWSKGDFSQTRWRF